MSRLFFSHCNNPIFRTEKGHCALLDSAAKTVKFGTIKIIFDCSLVVIAVVLSFAFLHGLYGVREGTVAAALLVGMVAKATEKIMTRL